MQTLQPIHEITSLTSSFMPAQIVLTANRLDLFTHLDQKAMSGEELAKALKTNTRATDLLCNALTSLGFLEKDNGLFQNSPRSDRYLVKGRPYYVGDNLRHQSHLWEKWSQLEKVIRSGQPLPRDTGPKKENEKQTREFTLAMANIGQLSAHQVVEGLDLRGVQSMIDLGGGPGTYAMEFAKKNDKMHVTLFDQPDVIAIAEQRIRDAGFEERISTLAGDAFDDEIGSGYDLAFLSNFIHILSLEDIVKIFKKLGQALNPEGRIVVKDFFVNEERTGPQFATQFALNMLLNTESGNTYTFSEINQAFQESGFSWLNSFEVGQHSRVIVAVKT